MTLPLILIVDDQPGNLTALGEMLQARHAVRVANSGVRALRLAQLLPQPALILIDAAMADMADGALLQRLRDHPETADIPVILLTAAGRPEDEERGLQLGAADCVARPIRPALLLARVHMQLALRQALHQTLNPATQPASGQPAAAR